MNRTELERLLRGPEPDQQPDQQRLGVFGISATCPGGADRVLTGTREVLSVVLRRDADAWPTDQEWAEILPQWFVGCCAPERTEQEKQDWLRWWQGLSWPEKQLRMQESKPSVGDWVYWFLPEMRKWYWWDTAVTDEAHLWVEIEVEDWPVPWDALRWLLRCAGATDVRLGSDPPPQ